MLFRVLSITMIKSERIAKRIREQLQVWKKDHTKLVVAIDGYAGSGKTTIGDFIAQRIESSQHIRAAKTYMEKQKAREECKFNRTRFSATVFEQSLISGGLAYYWYSFLDTFATVTLGLAPGSIQIRRHRRLRLDGPLAFL